MGNFGMLNQEDLSMFHLVKPHESEAAWISEIKIFVYHQTKKDLDMYYSNGIISFNEIEPPKEGKPYTDRYYLWHTQEGYFVATLTCADQKEMFRKNGRKAQAPSTTLLRERAQSAQDLPTLKSKLAELLPKEKAGGAV